ncbi:mCG1041293 [Mus musculus]|nr:mCG1041293 [Mus musculus]
MLFPLLSSHPQIEGKELSKHLSAGLKNDEAVLVKGQTLVLKEKTIQPVFFCLP